MKTPDFKKCKGVQKIAMVTCYDAAFAAVIEKSKIDGVLVGDSVAMVVYGKPDTLHASVDMIANHVEAVRSRYTGFLVADVPFLTAQKSTTDFIKDVHRLMRAGANAVKIEGIDGIEDKFKLLKSAGIPVMGHLGLTPQFINEFGGFKVQGKEKESQKAIFNKAVELEALGCFSLVLECVPQGLSQKITAELSIPTIGIGAGLETDGQILVLQDMLGLSEQKFKFVKLYGNLNKDVVASLDAYVQDTKTRLFPQSEHSFL